MATMSATKLSLLLLSSILVCTMSTPLSRRRSLSVIRKLNREGPFVGLITVYAPEENAFFATNAFKPHSRHPFVDLSGRRFRIGKVGGKEVVYVRCGVGMRNAVAATQQMLDLFKVAGVIHFGIAGSLENSLRTGYVSIPKQFAQTGLLEWLKPNATVGSEYFAHLDIGSYNVPEGEGINQLGHIGYRAEEFYSESGVPNVLQRVVWANVSQNWYNIAAKLEGMELERCLNSTVCLPEVPKVVIGQRGSTANIFVDNSAYREFLSKTFGVSLAEMESASVIMANKCGKWLPSDCYPRLIRRSWRTRWPELSESPWALGSSQHCQSCN
ncbi:hypothetical protein Sjap_001288 [Stephania japonica]|uniref:Nucleoside phosphorylase domain-containing protein n=1 Tax=Stephania japonica TaxID=461633 RepID=A0AAP0KJN4_9MAGN